MSIDPILVAIERVPRYFMFCAKMGLSLNTSHIECRNTSFDLPPTDGQTLSDRRTAAGNDRLTEVRKFTRRVILFEMGPSSCTGNLYSHLTLCYFTIYVVYI